MPSTKDLRKRIGSTKNTQQTTKAMKMVSAAKLRRAQEAIHSQRPYARAVGDLITRLFAIGGGEALHIPLFHRENVVLEEGAKKKLALVVVTSDRGLCGGFNANIIKGTQRFLASKKGDYESITLNFVGRKGYEFFKTKNVTMGAYFQELGGKVSFLKARKLTDALIEQYTSGQVDEVMFVYNEFKNAVSQKVVIENFLPLEATGNQAEAHAHAGDMIIVKPSVPALLHELLAKHFAAQTFRILLESQASEHGARMSAMENATKNAGEMIRKLTLQYNKQRQAGITKELLEIISGSESQKTSA